jgi:hypothetical protein
MTRTSRLAVRPAPPGAAAALCAAAFVAALAALVGCGPEPAEIDRGAVAGMTDENPDAGDVEDGALEAGSRHAGSLTLSGGVAYDGPAAVECGPAPPRVGSHPAQGEVQIGRVEGDAGEEPVAEREPGEGDDAHAEVDERFDVTLTAAGTSLAVTLHLPPEDAAVPVPALVATIGADGSYRESAGTAEVRLERGSQLTRSAATEHVSGSFRGSYRGEAGEGELAGRFTRCFFFD